MNVIKTICCFLLFLINFQTVIAAENNIYTLPEIELVLNLSEKAKEKLKAINERIKINFYLTYNPLDLAEPTSFTNEEAQFYELFGTRTLLLPPLSGMAYLPEWKIPKINNKKFEPLLTINVFSAKDKSEDNILDCSIYSGDYPKKSRTKISITC